MTDRPTPEEIAAEQQLERAQMLADYLVTFGGEHGARVLTDLASRNFVHRTTLIAPAPGQPIDPKLSDVNEGRRLCVLEILARVREARTSTSEPKKQAAAHSALSKEG